ncbi:MAG TPA: hypothetical protein VGS21_00155, partial [Acidimicrobiales bacterium]|nr:hypothetical protein [Acidimicrobiales bacterium]
MSGSLRTRWRLPQVSVYEVWTPHSRASAARATSTNAPPSRVQRGGVRADDREQAEQWEVYPVGPVGH